jgi:hypothetical protein
MNAFNARKINCVNFKEQFEVDISKRFSTLENLDENMNIGRTGESIGENIKFSVKYKLRH